MFKKRSCYVVNKRLIDFCKDSVVYVHGPSVFGLNQDVRTFYRMFKVILMSPEFSTNMHLNFLRVISTILLSIWDGLCKSWQNHMHTHLLFKRKPVALWFVSNKWNPSCKWKHTVQAMNSLVIAGNCLDMLVLFQCQQFVRLRDWTWFPCTVVETYKSDVRATAFPPVWCIV